MAQRVQLNGPEPTYASEKLEHALSKAAEGLALCDVDLDKVAGGDTTRSPQRMADQGGAAMTLAGVKAGDIVLCDRRGWRFYAIVVERHERELAVEPIDRRVTLPARQGPRGARDLAQEPRTERTRRRSAQAPVMTGKATGNGSGVAPVAGLVVVQVREAINPALAGRGDVSYQSSKLPLAKARTLVRLLLGRGEEPPIGEQVWSCPIAGGRRSVALRPG
jgi:hypothetical protein